MTEQELKKQFDLFTESWRFYRKWAIQAPLSNEQWEQVVMESKEIQRKYGEGDTVKYLILAVTNGLYEDERKMRK